MAHLEPKIKNKSGVGTTPCPDPSPPPDTSPVTAPLQAPRTSRLWRYPLHKILDTPLIRFELAYACAQKTSEYVAAEQHVAMLSIENE